MRADHHQQHLELLGRLDSVRLIGRQDDGLACLHGEGFAGDDDLSFAIQYLEQGVKWRGVLAEFLCFVEGEEGYVAIFGAQYVAVSDGVSLILCQIG